MIDLASNFFGAVKEIASLIPNFSEEKKEMLEDETRKLEALEKSFNDSAVSFKMGSRPDELLALAEAVRTQEKKLRELYVIYAKELRS